jgi:hypothetical protein
MAARVAEQAKEEVGGAAAGAGAGGDAGGAPAASFVALPDSLHLLIMGYLTFQVVEWRRLPLDRLAVSATAKDLLRLYGGGFERLRLAEQPGEELDALRGFLCRQEQLLGLTVRNMSLSPAVAAAIDSGGGRHLKMLKLRQWPFSITEEDAASLTSFFIAPHNYLLALEELEELEVGWPWTNRPSLEAFLSVLGQGPAPRLRELTASLDAAVSMELVASALEARAAKGCAGLAVLELGRLD